MRRRRRWTAQRNSAALAQAQRAARRDAAILAALDNPRLQLRDRANVVDLAVGYQYRRGRRLEQIGPLVLVSRKVPLRLLARKDRVPRYITVRGRRMRLDVVQVGEKVPLACIAGIPATQHKVFNAVPGGVAIAALDANGDPIPGKRGTTGVVVRRRDAPSNGPRYMLTCRHIVDTNDTVGQPWAGPGRGTWVANHPAGDASIFEIDRLTPRIECIGRYRKFIVPSVGLKVKKSGAASGLTASTVIGHSLTDVYIDNVPRVPAPAAAVNYYYVGPGDSGSVSVLDSLGLLAPSGNRVVCLNYAVQVFQPGEPAAAGVILPAVGTPVTVGMKMKLVLDGLRVVLVTV